MTRLDEIRTAYRDSLRVSDDDLWVAEGLAAQALAVRWKDRPLPVWSFLLAPPSAGKDTLLMGVTGLERYQKVSQLTPKALLSAYKDPDDPTDRSALRDWNGKLVVIHDFGQISEEKNAANTLFAQLRDCFSGKIVKFSGTQGKQEVESDFGLVIAATPEMDSLMEQYVQLGERFLYFRIARKAWNNAREQARERARLARSAQLLPKIKDQFSGKVAEVIDGAEITEVNVHDNDHWLFYQLASCLNFLKSRPDSKTKVAQDASFPDRQAAILSSVCSCRAMLDGRKILNEEDHYLARRVCYDAIAPPDWRMIHRLWAMVDGTTASDLRRSRGGGRTESINQLTEQWEFLNVARRSSKNKSLIQLHPEFRELMDECGILQGGKEGPTEE